MSQPGVKAVKIDYSSSYTLPDASRITIGIVVITGATGIPTTGTPTVIPGSPGVAPNRIVTPTATATQGLGGS